jgi:hypothetical protein
MRPFEWPEADFGIDLSSRVYSALLGRFNGRHKWRRVGLELVEVKSAMALEREHGGGRLTTGTVLVVVLAQERP